MDIYEDVFVKTVSLQQHIYMNTYTQNFPFDTILCLCSVCVNGSLVCTGHVCPVYGPWGSWSECSVSCGTGRRTRRRSCTHTSGGPLCADTIRSEVCSLPPCPGQPTEESSVSLHVQTQICQLIHVQTKYVN